MLSKCCKCFRGIKWRLRSHQVPKWHTHLENFCRSRAQKEPWCQMFLDNIDLITDQHLPKQTELLVRDTNIASEIIKIITNHFESQSNLFRFCIELFGSYLKLKYSQVINPSRSSLNRIARQYQQFQKLLIDLFVLYYNLEDREIVGQQVFYKSTLPCLASSFSFQNTDVHSTITRTAKLAMKSHIDKLQFQLQKYSSYTINEFFVRQEFQLKEKATLTSKTSSQKTQIVYSGTIQMINEIIRVSSPAQKKKLLDGLPKQIQSSIQQFNVRHKIETDKVEVDSKDLLSILSYVIVQANQSVFLAHLQIADLFAFSDGKSSKTHQILTAACQQIENGSIAKRNSDLQTTQMSFQNRKGSDGLNFFDQVSNSHLDL